MSNSQSENGEWRVASSTEGAGKKNQLDSNFWAAKWAAQKKKKKYHEAVCQWHVHPAVCPSSLNVQSKLTHSGSTPNGSSHYLHSIYCPQYFLNYKKIKQRCSPCPESSQDWPYLSLSCFSPFAAHWFTDTVQTRFSVQQLPQLGRSWLLDWTLKVYKPTRLLRFFSDTSILCLPFVCTHSLGQRSFVILHRLSGMVWLECKENKGNADWS